MGETAPVASVTARISDVVEILDHKRVPLSGQERQLRQGPYPYYGAQGVIDHIDDYLFEGRHILVAEDGENLNSRKLPLALFAAGRFWVNNHAHVLRVKKELADETFVLACLNQAHIRPYITGAAQPKLSQANLRQIEIPLPPLAIQRRIAGVLSAYDGLIENNLRRIQILEQMARALYREWFVEFRFPGHETFPRVTSLLGDIPQVWQVRPLNEVVDDIVDYRGKTPTKLNGKWSEEGILALSALNVKGGRLVNLEKSRRVSEDLYSRWMKNPLRRGDILLTSEAPLGELFFLCKEERYCLSQRLFSIRANRHMIAPAVLYSCLESEQTQHEMRSRASGATVSGIRQSELRNVPIVVPSRDVQERAEPVLLKLAELKATLDEGCVNLRRTRDLLLPRLLSGQLTLAEAAA